MERKARRGRDIQSEISKILDEDWDPLGVLDVAEDDEYGAYVGGVYRLLATGATCEQIAAHLSRIESEHMGLTRVESPRNITVAEKLRALDVSVREKDEI